MDMRCWKNVLLKWIKECGFMERDFFNIEQSDIDVFYKNFRLKHEKAATRKYEDLGDFLKEFYPKFEIHLDDENCLSSADYVYAYSLLLHFSCVKYPEKMFHEICKRLHEIDQLSIANFFQQFLDIEQITKETVRHAIAEVAHMQITSARFNDSFSSGSTSTSAGCLSPASFLQCDSPLKTPNRSARSQRISPSTPKTCLLELRTKELHNLKAQLETERYEKGLLEVQIKQNGDEIRKTHNENKRLLQQIQDLKNDQLLKTSDSVKDRNGEENQAQKSIRKELSQKEEQIIKLSDKLRALNEEKELMEKKLNYAESQIVISIKRIQEFEFKVDSLNDQLKQKNDQIEYLTNTKFELEKFIFETRSAASSTNPDLNASGDCLDSSFLRHSNSTNGSNSLSSPENLGVSVVDVQLREKERENQLLKEKLKYIHGEHKRLATQFTKLIPEFVSPLDNSSEPDNENLPFTEVKINFEEQFSIFDSCIEQLNKFHKTEQNKIKQLDQKSSRMLKENEDLTKELTKVTGQLAELKETLASKSKVEQELELMLEKCKNDLACCEKQKSKLYIEVQSLQDVKQKLNETVQQLETKLELQKEESNKLLANNKKLNENEENLHSKMHQLQSDFSHKTLQWEEKLKQLNETIIIQTEDIEQHKRNERTIKCNYEQMVVKNEELKRENQKTNACLGDLKNELKVKEHQLTSLGENIEDLKEKNVALGKNINRLIEEHEREMLLSQSSQTELNEQFDKLKDQLTQTTLILDSKQECLLQVKTKLNRILQLFVHSNENDTEDILATIVQVNSRITDMLKDNDNIKSEVCSLQQSEKENLNQIEALRKELQEKLHDLDKSQEELVNLTKDNLAKDQKIELLEQQQVCIFEKLNQDLAKKDNELRDRLREASSEYAASLDRLEDELKLEKRNCNDKEMELIVCKAEHIDAKKKLNDAEEETHQLRNDIQQLRQSCERLKQFESRVVECAEENNKMRMEIVDFKQQVTENALRLLEADRALKEFMELTKEQDATKSEMEILQSKMKEKENLVLELELKVQQQCLHEEELKQLKEKLQEQKDVIFSLQEQVERLHTEKERLTKESQKKEQEIVTEKQEKHILLTSLEKSADQLKLSIEEKQQQSALLEQKLQDFTEKNEMLTQQNIKLQGDLIEREGELRLYLEERQQERQDFEAKMSLENKNLSETLEFMDTSLMEIVAIMENKFHLGQESLQKDIKNVFNYQAHKSEENIEKIRTHLNHILFKQQTLEGELQELTTKNKEAHNSVASLKDRNNNLLAKLSQQEKALKETQEQLEKEELIAEKRVALEVKRLEEDLLNLEKVNERLANDNLKIQVTLSSVEEELKGSKLQLQSLEKETVQLKEDVRSKCLLLDKLQQDDKKLRQTLKDKSLQYERVSEKLHQVELQLKDKSTKLQNMEKEHQEAKGKAAKHQQSQQSENKKLQEKLKLLQTSNESLEAEVSTKNKELLLAKNKNSDLLQQQKDLEQQNNLISKKLDEMVTSKLNAESKCEQLQSETQQIKRDLDFTRVLQQTHQEDCNRLNQEIESLKVDKQHLRDEVHENKLSLQRANDNLTQLIQQISSIQLEKEAALEENLLLRKQLKETGESQSSSETKMKSIIEKSQDLERKLLAAENELKSLRANLQKSENCAEKWQIENEKLRDNQEASTKRIEKLAIKLGDTQAKSAKLERDNEKLSRTLDAHTMTVEALQKEKDLLQSEAKTLKERLSRAERGHEQLAAKAKNLEHVNMSLQQIKQKLEASEIDGKTKLNKLEKMREISEEKVRKLTNALNNAENVNVKLNLEIGALNSQLKENKFGQNQEHSFKIKELNQDLKEAQEVSHKYEELNEKLKIELGVLQEENCSLKDQLSKTSLSLQINSQKCERFASEMEQIRSDLLVMRQEKSQIELQHETSLRKLNEFELQNTKLAYEGKSLVKTLEQKIVQLEEELATKSMKILDLENEIEMVREKRNCQSSLGQKDAAASSKELEDLRTKLAQTEDIHLKEQQVIAQLRLDNQILHTKYQESKQRALNAAKSSEERIKENRLELEDKLEKMKSKMKAIYTEEITKMKAKQEREMATIKSELEALKLKNTKYEEHTRKLSNQIVRLNENILQHQKENAIASTKLKHATDQLREYERKKRPAGIHVSSISGAVTAPNIGPNFAMEDEEGEVFNNTYLTDLKTGRMSELMSRDVCVEELKYRNSLLPPHLRSTYAAQYDHEFLEDELKEGGTPSLDDSMSALLSTTAGGTRKKCTGVTHYKRPGPPTPSKNGRLSFGGSSEPAREILKESFDTNGGQAVSSSKTPARFNFFSSRFSMGNTRDETCNIKRGSDALGLRNVIQKPKMGVATTARRILVGVGYTSTPRKSKVHYDQRRLLNQLIKSSPSPSPFPLTVNSKVDKEIETPLTQVSGKCDASKEAASHNTVSKRLAAIAGGLRSIRRKSAMYGRRLSRRMQELCTPTSGETTSSALSTPAVGNCNANNIQVAVSSSITTSGSAGRATSMQRRLRKRHKKERGTRPSLYLRGNIFAQHRTPKRGLLQDVNRHRSRKQRLEQFNKGRNVRSFKTKTPEEETDKTINCGDMNAINSDLKNDHKELVGDAVAVAKGQLNNQKFVQDTFTFGEEQFEQPDLAGSAYLRDYEGPEDYDDDDGGSDEKPVLQYDFPVTQALINSQDLDNFDRFVANENANEKNSSVQSSTEHFQKLLQQVESSAPFEVKQISDRNSSHSTKSTNSHSHVSYSSNLPSRISKSETSSQHGRESINLTTATPHPSAQSNSAQLSRTIYGSTVIYNHRLPHINKTYVRKSSIYVKNWKKSPDNMESSSCNEVVLITNQTITFVDIMRMWSQMDNSTRIIVSFAVLASFTTLFSLFLSLCSRR